MAGRPVRWQETTKLILVALLVTLAGIYWVVPAQAQQQPPGQWPPAPQTQAPPAGQQPGAVPPGVQPPSGQTPPAQPRMRRAPAPTGQVPPGVAPPAQAPGMPGQQVQPRQPIPQPQVPQPQVQQPQQPRQQAPQPRVQQPQPRQQAPQPRVQQPRQPQQPQQPAQRKLPPIQIRPKLGPTPNLVGNWYQYVKGIAGAKLFFSIIYNPGNFPIQHTHKMIFRGHNLNLPWPVRPGSTVMVLNVPRRGFKVRGMWYLCSPMVGCSWNSCRMTIVGPNQISFLVPGNAAAKGQAYRVGFSPE